MTHWEAYQLYRCRHCGENCINRFDELVTKIGECRTCHQIPDNTIDTNTISDRPEGAPPSHGGSTEDRARTPPTEGRGESCCGRGAEAVADGGEHDAPSAPLFPPER